MSLALLALAMLAVGSVTYTEQVSVTCPGLPQDTAVLTHWDAFAVPKGVVAFFSGGNGTTQYAESQDEEAWLRSIVTDGYDVIQVRWQSAWWTSLKNLVQEACRPATVIAFIADRHGPAILVGQSGGAAQVAYSVEHYGAETPLAVLGGGPPDLMDILKTNPPLEHPGTAFRLFVGQLDTRQQPTVERYFEALAAAGTEASYEVVPGTKHRIQATAIGRETLRQAIEGGV